MTAKTISNSLNGWRRTAPLVLTTKCPKCNGDFQYQENKGTASCINCHPDPMDNEQFIRWLQRENSKKITEKTSTSSNGRTIDNSLLSAALYYASKKIPVFPCNNNKQPLTGHGFKEATTDNEQIKKWWGENPGASIGMPTGATTGLWVLDTDLYKPGAKEALEKLLSNRLLPPTKTQTTGGGGKQYFFLHPGPGKKIKCSNGKLGIGIDIKGDGGYVILPPSGHHSGNHYKWETPTLPSAKAPGWLVEQVEAPSKRTPTTSPKRAPKTSKYALQAIEDEAHSVQTAPEGERNEALNRAAFSLGQLVAGGELSERLAISTLMDAATESGLGQSEVERTLRSGLDAGKMAPRKTTDDSYDGRKTQPSSREPNTGGQYDSNDGYDATQDEKTIFLPPPPLEVFHPGIRKAIENVSETKNTPVEVPLSGVLAASSGIICRARGITIKAGWSEKGNLYLGLVGKSSCGKSPAINSTFKPIYGLEKGYQERFKNEMETYNLSLQEWKSKKKEEPPAAKPEPPARIDLILDDWTIEAAADSLSANPRGLLLYRDELAGMLLEMDKYSGEKGVTKTRLMTAYDGNKPWKINRVNADRSNYIPEPCVSLYGGIQPSIAKDLFNSKDIDSGFLGRIIFIQAIQKKPSTFTDEEELPETFETLNKLVQGLISLPFNGDTKYVQVHPEAKKVFVDWHDKLACEAWLSNNDGEGSLLNKIRAQGLRVCLNLHCMDAVMNDQSEMLPVSKKTMVKALKLMDWLKVHTQATWKMLTSKAASPSGDDVRVAQSILRLEDKIKKSWLATSEITEMANDGLDRKFHLSTEQVGKICTRLNLEKMAKSHARGFIITPEDLEKLNSFLPQNKASYPSYPSEDSNDGGSEHDTSKDEPSHPSCSDADDDEGVPI